MKHLSDIRSSFLSFFEKSNHEIITSSPIVPQNDPTLMFTNAGMVQFKDVFTGREKRSYKRAATSQKCVRAGGKHNDLDNVGYTARHHTFFEMLGNFSFGDYFKEEAISYAWQMVTKEFGINPEKLCITVYHTDDEAYNIWKKLTGFCDDKIIRIPTNDNFWSMGDMGPCGPCSEIFYDHGEGVFGGPPGTKDADGDRFIEIWNLVFMQFEQLANGERIPLPNPSIDTGMGLERIAAVLQGVHNNYDIDLFKTIIESIEDHVGNTGDLHSYRVIADHLRACSFMIADGITPSNEGRGYVLRRIMRRAMRHVHLLKSKEALMHKLVPTLVDTMGHAYPELVHAEHFIGQTFKQEEDRFRQTLDKGLRLLDDERINIKNNILPGHIAFKLYDTYGFPLDLTEDILRKENMTVDVDGFTASMAEQKQRARQAWTGSGAKANDQLYFDLKEDFGSTEFLGYASTHSEGLIQAIVVDGQKEELIKAGQKAAILCQQTPFYGESGGQKGDVGVIETDDARFIVTDTKKYLDGLIIHYGVLENGQLKVSDSVRLLVDADARSKTAANHSATHLLHSALRSVLGTHVVQKGSLVEKDRLRFDFTHNACLSRVEIDQIETWVNQHILKNVKTETNIMTPDEAIQKGAMALFGERYGEEVRVVCFDHFSTELCGGTHVKATGDIGLFKILSECSIASGIRRIEAITGTAIIQALNHKNESMNALQAQMKEMATATHKQIEDLKRQLLLSKLTKVDQARESEGVYWSLTHVKDVKPSDLRFCAEHLLKISPGVVIVTTFADDKVSFVIGVTREIAQAHNASTLVKKATAFLGGQGGGGKPELAQGGGIYTEKCKDLLVHLLAD